MDEWEKWPDGHLVINSVLGWETATMSAAALIRLVYAGNPEEERAGGKPLQMALTENQIEALIRDLTTTLDAVKQHGQGSAG